MEILNILKKWFLKNILRKKYLREGKCLRCGACCTRIFVRHQKNIIKDEQEFLSLKYLHPFYSYLKITGKDENGLIFECQNFDKEKHICKIHKTRPAICRKYPDEFIFSMGACLSDECGYKFTPLESFKMFRRGTRRNITYGDYFATFILRTMRWPLYSIV